MATAMSRPNWPPNSPDLNPVDYSIWGALQQLDCRLKIRDLEHERNATRLLEDDQPGLDG